MKKFTTYGLLSLFTIIFLSACGSTQTAAERAQLAAEIEDAVEMSDFTFEATYAYPTGFKSIYLSPYYEVKVSADTVKAYLPYYGRAYTAPIDPREGGYNFTSTDFVYEVISGKRAGNWLVNIIINDLDRQVVFNFDIYENGTGRLSVNDVNRQAISYHGNIKTEKE
ncbi:MAG: DUF4251 domain-containing protein [Fermentimonas sp.]|nr:DUF4251 domain-containing protein [Fermentimonas sp.]